MFVAHHTSAASALVDASHWLLLAVALVTERALERRASTGKVTELLSRETAFGRIDRLDAPAGDREDRAASA